jgi:hypothetical protein
MAATARLVWAIEIRAPGRVAAVESSARRRQAAEKGEERKRADRPYRPFNPQLSGTRDARISYSPARLAGAPTVNRPYATS